ncbi:MAG: aspartate aminotransferase family protein [Lachnospiraceae bacterium]|nr:aspartate aminotransferase family protein [Lachnospiraceae bacterium]
MNFENFDYTNSELIDKHLINAYNRKVVFSHGEGMELFDIEGNAFLDMGAGIAVSALGYNNEKFKNKLKEQLDKLIHVSNLYYTPALIKASYNVAEKTGLSKVFFTNSGAEANEGAIKLARKYKWLQNKESKGEVIAMEHSFHGRTMGALSVTGTEHYRTPFEPLIGGVKFCEYNNLDSVKAAVTEDTAAIILETLQGEGGIHPATEEFIKGIRALCDEKDIVMILDEVQCGMGRTGKYYAYEHYGIKPDIVTTAKALGCGVPVGAFVANEKLAAAMVPGDHGTTYGGNPFACAAINAVYEIFEEDKLIDNVNEVSSYLFEKLNLLKDKYEVIKDVRGKGLMVGIEFDCPAAKVVGACQEKGLLLISAGSSIVRVVPPLIVTKNDIDKFINILTDVLNEI